MGTEGQDTPGEPGAPVALHRPSCPLCPWGHWRPSPSGKDGKDKLCSRSGSVGLPSLPAHLSALCSPSPPHAPPTCRGRPSPRASPGRGLGLRSSMAPGSLPPPLPPTPSTLRPPRLDTALRDRRNDIGSFQTSQPGSRHLRGPHRDHLQGWSADLQTPCPAGAGTGGLGTPRHCPWTPSRKVLAP